MLPRSLRLDIAPVFAPLLYPHRYKGAWGGRGSGKSHHFAEQAVTKNIQPGTRGVCIREVQNTLKESVKELIETKIRQFELGSIMHPYESEIRTPGDGVIIFRGMQSMNAEQIKSLEGFDWAWIEEGQTLSHHSWKTLRPTLRKEGSEILASWNPRNRTDAIDQWFRKKPIHPDAVSAMANWRDNPHLTKILYDEMCFDFEKDSEEAEHIWEGAYGVDKGAILAKWVDRAHRQGRIHDRVRFDPKGAPIEISSDIGFRDTASWWFWQRKPGGFSLLFHIGDSGLDADEWIVELSKILDARDYPLGKIWLPHDARAQTFQSRHSAVERFLKHFGAMRVGIVEMTSKADRINAARTIIRKCEIHETACAEGIDGLNAWAFKYDQEKQTYSREPDHNWASHPADAFSYGCQVMETQPPPPPAEKSIKWWHQQTAAELFALDAPVADGETGGV